MTAWHAKHAQTSPLVPALVVADARPGLGYGCALRLERSPAAQRLVRTLAVVEGEILCQPESPLGNRALPLQGRPTLLGLPVFGLRGFLGAAVGSLWLLLSILRSGREQ